MSLTLQDVVRRGDDHVETGIEDETLMMSIQQGNYYSLDGSAQQIWQMIDGSTKVRDVFDALLATYDVEPGRCKTDLVMFLDELMKNGLIVKVEPK